MSFNCFDENYLDEINSCTTQIQIRGGEDPDSTGLDESERGLTVGSGTIKDQYKLLSMSLQQLINKGSQYITYLT